MLVLVAWVSVNPRECMKLQCEPSLWAPVCGLGCQPANSGGLIAAPLAGLQNQNPFFTATAELQSVGVFVGRPHSQILVDLVNSENCFI